MLTHRQRSRAKAGQQQKARTTFSSSKKKRFNDCVEHNAAKGEQRRVKHSVRDGGSLRT
jgi:hypothetical protein